MRESRKYGSVRGALSNERPYRDIGRIWLDIGEFADPDSASLHPGYHANFNPGRYSG